MDRAFVSNLICKQFVFEFVDEEKNKQTSNGEIKYVNKTDQAFTRQNRLIDVRRNVTFPIKRVICN